MRRRPVAAAGARDGDPDSDLDSELQMPSARELVAWQPKMSTKISRHFPSPFATRAPVASRVASQKRSFLRKKMDPSAKLKEALRGPFLEAPRPSAPFTSFLRSTLFTKLLNRRDLYVSVWDSGTN